MVLAGHVARMGEKKSNYKNLKGRDHSGDLGVDGRLCWNGS